MNTQVDKKKIRSRIKQIRKGMSNTQKISLSNSIFKKIEQLNIFRDAKIILLYWSIEDEVNTHDFINKWSAQKEILLPVTQPDKLELKLFTESKKLKKSVRMNLMEPIGNTFTEYDKIDLAIIPGLAFDIKNNRLGYGKGYYDMLLTQVNTYKIGVCFDFQFLHKIPTTEYDVKMDLVIIGKPGQTYYSIPV